MTSKTDKESEKSSNRSTVDPGATASERHFDTSHLMTDLAGRSARGGLVTVSAQVVKFVLQMGSTMVLARLLTPADFGLIAMVAVFTGFIERFKDLGLSAATVQRREINHDQVSTLFWINLGVSTLLMILAAAAAPLVAWFYGEEELIAVTIAISIIFLFGGLSAQHIALLRRQMRFTALAVIEIGAMLIGIVLGVTVAVLGGGYWSLVALTAGQACATAALSMLISGWRPGWWNISSEVKESIGFGANLTGFNIVNYLCRNVDKLLIGRQWGATELGVYSKAYSLLLMPVQQINGPIAAVALPALSRLQSNGVEYRRYYLKMVQIIAYVSMPLVVVLAVLAEEVVLVLLGQQWMEAVPIFRIFAVFVVIQNVLVTTGWVLQSMGRASRLFKWGAVQAPVFVVACFLGLPWGAQGVAIAATIQAMVMAVPSMWVAYYDSPIAVRDVCIAVARPAWIALALFACTWSVLFLMNEFGLVLRLGAVVLSALSLGVCVFLLFGSVRKDLQGVFALVRRKQAVVYP